MIFSSSKLQLEIDFIPGGEASVYIRDIRGVV
jgi:hypothetical protein